MFTVLGSTCRSHTLTGSRFVVTRQATRERHAASEPADPKSSEPAHSQISDQAPLHGGHLTGGVYPGIDGAP